jgi:NADPH:quinone reductase-like Zn-dependent oxidoreductase
VLAAVTRSPGELVIEDIEGPGHARAGHVIVRPEAVGICGSDFHLFSGDVAALSGASDFYPRVQGHEVAVIVADPGDRGAIKAGDRVAIWPPGPGQRLLRRARLGGGARPGPRPRPGGRAGGGARGRARAAEAFGYAMSRPPDAVKIVVTVN